MGFNQEKHPRRSFHSPRKDSFFRGSRFDLLQTFKINQDSRGKINFDENNFASLAENLSNELHREYPLIMSIYKFEDHWELDRSDTSSTISKNWNEFSSESYNSIKDLGLVFDWNINSKENKEIDLCLNFKTNSNRFTWNFRKKEKSPPVEFAMSAPMTSNIKLFWNEDYCLDIAKPSGEIISIWLSTRDYT